jgi:hypothetical protein
MKPGDLVQFVHDPLVTERSVIPAKKKPYGIVIEVFDRYIGTESESQAIMQLARVYWFTNKWNTLRCGLAEEHPADLHIIQSL